MATIQERTRRDGTTSFQVHVRLKGYPVQTATFQRKTDARRWAQQTEAAIREGRYFKTSEARRHTLAELIDRYMRDVLPLKPKSLVKQSRQLVWWKSELGPYLLSDVSPALIAEARDKLASGLTPSGSKRAPATVVRYLAALSHAFSVAVREWGWLDDNPVKKVSRPKEPRGRVRYLSDEERDRLLAACRDSESSCLLPVVVLALSTGMRQGEIMNLRWQDVDLAKGRITLHETKNNERRVVPLVHYANEVLRTHTKVRRLDSDLLFPSERKSGRPATLRGPWEAAVKKAELEDFRFHDLRHSAASYLAMGGASLAEIAEVLGHKTLNMVRRYAHLSEVHTAKVVARMNEQVFGGL